MYEITSLLYELYWYANAPIFIICRFPVRTYYYSVNSTNLHG